MTHTAQFLIIDDEYYFRQSLKTILEESGLSIECVGEANNGEAGLALIRQCQPDFVIVDINMPILDGLGMIQQCILEKICSHFILLTGYAEFIYAKQAISMGVDDYILKPIDTTELLRTIGHTLSAIEESSQLKRHQQQMQENFVFQNCLLHWNELESEKMSAITEEWEYPFFRCVVIKKIAKESKVFSGNFSQALSGYTHSGFLMREFFYYQDRLCYLLNYSDESVLISFFDLLQEEVSLASLKAGIGQRYAQLCDLHHSYYQATAAVSYFKEENVVFYEDLVEKASSQKTFASCRQEVLSAIASGSQEKVTQFFDHMENEPSSFQLNCQDLLMLFVLIYIDIKPLVEKYGLRQFDKFYTEFPEYIFQSYPVADMLKKLRETATSLCYAIGDAKGQNDYIDHILRYIQNHYQESSLSVTRLASQFNLNYGYLCTMFKKCTGATLNNYITAVRLEKAKKAFDAGWVNVSKTASAVGYADPSYFCKCFKKKYSLSPQQYLAQIAGEP